MHAVRDIARLCVIGPCAHANGGCCGVIVAQGPCAILSLTSPHGPRARLVSFTPGTPELACARSPPKANLAAVPPSQLSATPTPIIPLFLFDIRDGPCSRVGRRLFGAQLWRRSSCPSNSKRCAGSSLVPHRQLVFTYRSHPRPDLLMHASPAVNPLSPASPLPFLIVPISVSGALVGPPVGPPWGSRGAPWVPVVGVVP